MIADGVSYLTVLREFIFNKDKHNIPPAPLPHVKTDLLQLDNKENMLVWFGHSSYFMQVDGKSILVDPVLSKNASPVSFTTRSFAGTDVYQVDDLPPIDLLFITHDHWDHLDYKAIRSLRPRVKKVVTGLGTAAHLERWGFQPGIIEEKDWGEEVVLDKGWTVHVLPARHFSGRGLKRNTSLWVSFALTTPSRKLYLGGDSGYGDHFKKIGKDFGPFDLAILECGQYNQHWKYIHMIPEETVSAAHDLGAKCLMPVHWARFSLALHAWDEPIRRAVARAQQTGMPVLHPMIGEKIHLDENLSSSRWWENVG